MSSVPGTIGNVAHTLAFVETYLILPYRWFQLQHTLHAHFCGPNLTSGSKLKQAALRKLIGVWHQSTMRAVEHAFELL